MQGGHEQLAIRALAEHGGTAFMAAGITPAHFRDAVAREMFEWGMERCQSMIGLTPAGLEARFSSYSHEPATVSDMTVAIEMLIDSKLRRDATIEIQKHVEEAGRAENAAPVMASLASKLAELSSASAESPLIDGFDLGDGAGALCLQEFKAVKEGRKAGLRTGLPRFDRVTGGVRPGELVAIIGRTGKGKSWVSVKIVAEAIMDGVKVCYYPLEMDVASVMYRLHPFLARHLGVELSNRKLARGSTDIKNQNYEAFLRDLCVKYEGSLKVLDTSVMREKYTPSKIDADVDRESPGLVVVDYLTLLRVDDTGVVEKDYQIVKQLSSDLKFIATKYQVPVVVVAQVNRLAIRSRDDGTIIPQLQYISFGDALGADADKVIGINKSGNNLYYGLVKNRNGEEIPKTTMRFAVDSGELEEIGESLTDQQREQEQFGEDATLYDAEEEEIEDDGGGGV